MNFIPFPTLFLGKEIAHELTVFCAGCTYMWTVLQKVAYDATDSTRNFAKLCQNYARITKLYSWFPKLCSQNDVDSVHRTARNYDRCFSNKLLW